MVDLSSEGQRESQPTLPIPFCGSSDCAEHFFDAFPPARVPSYIEGKSRGESAGGFVSELHEAAPVRQPLRQFE